MILYNVVHMVSGMKYDFRYFFDIQGWLVIILPQPNAQQPFWKFMKMSSRSMNSRNMQAKWYIVFYIQFFKNCGTNPIVSDICNIKKYEAKISKKFHTPSAVEIGLIQKKNLRVLLMILKVVIVYDYRRTRDTVAIIGSGTC